MINNAHSVILTHERTDFDALASLLGAALLFPNALPVLPHQLNRNVREFLALYRNQFPFLQRKELPRTPVERVILVDTRSANLPKGVQDTTQFQVIDHHSFGSKVPADWEFWSEAVGANTTLLVEKLMERHHSITPVQATLLALGIHEDTGSLTYASTTARDVLALAWLMQPEHAVNLEVLREFLQHPLDSEQRSLLQILIDQSHFIEIDGHTVVIACAEAPDPESELSTLAHRLRNFHECDAVFMVVRLDDMIQMVARSSTDAIDVGEVARQLGGGGHARAAAASLHTFSLTQIADQIVRLLHQQERPTINVGQIMSLGRPQMLAPTQSIDEAAVLMRRYGHEGFPVVEVGIDGRDVLLGVITRREADRAMTHELGNATVRRFMQAGQFTAHPSDSIQQLRQLMIESGWGQIPVVDDEGAIIGIVTRTDLIKLWDDIPFPQQRRAEIDERLHNSLAPAQYRLLQRIGAEVEAMGFAVYVVGGFVRDLLVDEQFSVTSQRPSPQSVDMDIVIEGDAIALAERIQARYGGRIVLHRRFGTAKWLLHHTEQPVDVAALLAPVASGTEGSEIVKERGRGAEEQMEELPEHLDFVTARTEFYTAPTVLPTVEQGSIKLDLHRRDFTINTLALCLNPDRWGELLDFYGGVKDLAEGVVRVLHSLSFVDDPTRILRAVRYEQRFDFQIESRTLELLHDAVVLLDRVTAARLRHEFERILQERTPEKALQRLTDLQILQQLHPDLTIDAQIIAHFVALRKLFTTQQLPNILATEAVERLYWGLLARPLPAETHQILIERLGLRGETQRLMEGLCAIHEQIATLASPTLKPSTAVAILDQSTDAALALYIALDLEPSVTTVLQTYVNQWQQLRPSLDGRDLQELGIPRGPLYGQILGAIRAALLDGQIASRDEEIALAKAMAM